MGGFSTLGGGLTWEEIKSKLESEGAKNKAYDGDVDGVFDLAAIPDTLTGKDADSVDGYHLSDDRILPIQKIAFLPVEQVYSGELSVPAGGTATWTVQPPSGEVWKACVGGHCTVSDGAIKIGLTDGTQTYYLWEKSGDDYDTCIAKTLIITNSVYAIVQAVNNTGSAGTYFGGCNAVKIPDGIAYVFADTIAAGTREINRIEPPQGAPAYLHYLKAEIDTGGDTSDLVVRILDRTIPIGGGGTHFGVVGWDSKSGLNTAEYGRALGEDYLVIITYDYPLEFEIENEGGSGYTGYKVVMVEIMY